MQSLKDLLRDVEESEEYKRASGEGLPSGAYDVDLPETLEYRATIVDSKYGPAKSSGKPQAQITLEITEPAEYEGARLAAYFQMPADNDGSIRSLNSLLGALQAPSEQFADDDYEGYVQSWTGYTLVIAVNKWGDELDRNGVRWTNRDTGQKLKTDVKPKKAKRAAPDLRSDINIPKPQEPNNAPIIVDVAEAPAVQPPAAEPAQTTTLPGGVNLPPGLRG